MVKNQPTKAEDTGERGSISESGRSPGGGNGNPLQYSSDTTQQPSTVHRTAFSFFFFHLFLLVGG